MKIGVLSLQGCVEPHMSHLAGLGVSPVPIRAKKDLDGIEGLILPGGESTTMLKLAKVFSLWEPLCEKARQIPYWGICAGSILMAREVENPKQESMAIMDIVVQRNSYGRQLESFQQDVTLYNGDKEPAVFIRAPKFLSWGSAVAVKGTVGEDSVFLQEGYHMVTAFHPELTNSSWFHQYFMELARSQASI